MTRSRKAADDQIQAALYAFTIELPDPNQDLFFQSPSTFPLFPEFPLEIRRLIWKETFPQTRHSWCCDIGASCISHLRDIAPPVSAHINQESRIETLQHYSMLLPNATVRVMLRSGTLVRMRKQLAIFWNCERNILSINFRSSWISHLSEIQQKYPNLDTRLVETEYEMFWRRHFTDDLQSFMASVRTLELRMRGWDNT